MPTPAQALAALVTQQTEDLTRLEQERDAFKRCADGLAQERDGAQANCRMLKTEVERLRNAAKPVIDYWFEEDATGTQSDHNKAFLELSNAYYRRCNHAAMADKGE